MTPAIPLDSARRVRVDRASTAAADVIAAATNKPVDTPTKRRIVTALAVARELADIVIVYGAPGVGKTTAALEFSMAMHRVWFITACPALAGIVPCLKRVCDAVGAGYANNKAAGAAELHDAAVGCMSVTGGLLIVDEAQHLGATTLEQLRAIHDAAGVGLALIGDRDLYAHLSAAGLDGLRARIGRCLNIETNTPEDAAALAAAWGVNSAGGRKLLAEVCASAGGLRSVVKSLALAELSARGEDRPPTIDDLRAGWAELGGV